MPADGMSAAAK